jgi:lipid II:glycine glycyltransferase (peptidoglycan interpeptide bridge formation enzyme)
MIVYSYINKLLPSAKGLFNDLWPLPFHEELANYNFNSSEVDTLIFYDKQVNAYMPIRYIKVKLLKFGQVQYAPLRDGELLSKEEEQLFLDHFIAYCKKKHLFHHLIQSHPSGFTRSFPNNSAYCEFGSYVTDLSIYDDELLLNSYDTKYKKAISHSIKNGAVVKFGLDQLTQFYTLYQYSISKAKIYCDSYSSIHSLVSCLGEKKCEIGVVYDGEQAVGAILIQYTNHTAYVTHAGMAGKSKLYGAVKFLHYEMMKRLRDKNVKYYDFVGVRINNKTEALDGIFRFKKGFGGKLNSGYLWKIDLNTSIMKVYNKIYDFRFKDLPQMKDIIDQENLGAK